MFFKKKKDIGDHAKQIDKLITGLIIGGAVASMIGLSKTNKGKKVTENIKSECGKAARGAYKIFGKVLVKILSLFNKK